MMKYKKTAVMCIVYALLLAGICTYASEGGSESDPVVTLSYLTDSFQPYILSYADKHIETAFGDSFKGLTTRLEALGTEASLYASAYLKTDGVLCKTSSSDETYTLQKNSVVIGAEGTRFMICSGSAEAYIKGKGRLIDLTDGTECGDGSYLTCGHVYIVSDADGGIKAADNKVNVNVCGVHKTAGLGEILTGEYNSNTNSDVTFEVYADVLHRLGLFKGTDKGYELDRPATRVEALVMLIRILGEEKYAVSYSGSGPFTDVPEWAEGYVGYAYEKGYTNGISDTLYGSQNPVTRAQYLTFVLRALGYSEDAGDFIWNEAASKCEALGVLSIRDMERTSGEFTRGCVALCSYKALGAYLKDVPMTLAERLISRGIFTSEEYRKNIID